MINRHFPKSQILHKIFDRNTVNVSYNCMQNISNIYKGHNSKIRSRPCNQLTLCNCRVKEEFSMGCNCQTMNEMIMPKYELMTFVSLYQTHKKSFLVWQKKNERKGIITIKSRSTTEDIHTRRHFQVMCGI